MRLGATRHGPLAPDACQLGKYDALTSTGEPGLSTSKEMRSSPVLMWLTAAWRTGMLSGCWMSMPVPTTLAWPCNCSVALSLVTLMRCQPLGPSAAMGTSHVDGSCWYQRTPMSIQSMPPFGAFLMTAGCSRSGDTTAESLTSKISHGLEVATGRRSGLAWAWARASVENAM